MILRATIMGLTCIAMAGCASNGTETPKAEAEKAEPARGIGPQELASGECGLFLWTIAEPRRLVFFSKAGSESGIVDLGGEPKNLVQTDSDGDIFGQFMTEMTYKPEDVDGLLNLSLEPGTLLEQGQRTRSARLTFTDAEGWEMIVPVAGVRACQDQ